MHRKRTIALIIAAVWIIASFAWRFWVVSASISNVIAIACGYPNTAVPEYSGCVAGYADKVPSPWSIFFVNYPNEIAFWLWAALPPAFLFLAITDWRKIAKRSSHRAKL